MTTENDPQPTPEWSMGVIQDAARESENLEEFMARVAHLHFMQAAVIRGERAMREDYQRILASPPEGWSTFGTHIDQPNVELEFWGEDGGVPIWERPVRR
jgi:hypothetical protein